MSVPERREDSSTPKNIEFNSLEQRRAHLAQDLWVNHNTDISMSEKDVHVTQKARVMKADEYEA